MHSGRLFAATLLGTALMSATQALGTFTVTIDQVGTNVVANGSGTIDLTDLTLSPGGAGSAVMIPAAGSLQLGGFASFDTYSGSNVQLFAFGTSFGVTIGSGSGASVAVVQNSGSLGNLVDVPVGYVSGAALSDTATYNGTFASLGLTPGVYTDTWGTGAHADSFVIDIVAPTPEPASLALLGAGLAGIGAVRRRCRR